MPRTKISEFSSTPASNTDIDSINIAEGCAPSGINDAIRELMAQLKDFQTGAVGDSFNGPVGTTTASTGAFTTLSASGAVTLSGGTANGVTYLNGSKVVTSGSALTFDGTNLGVGVSTAYARLQALGTIKVATGNAQGILSLGDGNGSTVNVGLWRGAANAPTTDGNFLNLGGYDGMVFAVGAAAIGSQSEAMRLTSTGLGIGTSSITGGYKLQVNGNLLLSSTTPLVVGNSTLTLLGDNTSSTGLLLNTAGNLGLGVTPSAGLATANYRLFEIGLDGGGSIYSGTNQTLIGTNIAWSGGTPNYKRTGFAPTLYNQQNGAHSWSTAPSGTAGNAITFTQAMTLDASGNLLVGITSANAQLHVRGSSTTDGSIKFNNQLDSTAAYNTSPQSGSMVALKYDSSGNYAGMGGWSIGKENATDGNFSSYFAMHTRANGGAITERARIDSSGNLLVGTTSTLVSGSEKVSINCGSTNGLTTKTSGGASSWNYFAWNSATSGNNGFIEFGTEGTYTARGSITYNRAGGLTTYNTTSDYRAKDIIGPVTDSGALIDSTPVYMGKMKGATQERPMFIAHETPEYAHTGVKDAVDADGNPVYQQMDASALIPVMWAEIQSLRKRLADAGL